MEEKKTLKEKMEEAWMKVGKFLLWTLAALCCACLTYMVYVHRDVIKAAVKGEPLPKGKGKCCHCVCKKKK